MNIKGMKTLFTLLLAMSLFNSAGACTDFRLTAKDGSVLITRSMEYALDMQANLRTSTRGRQFSMLTPDNQPGIKWQAKFGYIFLDGMNQDFAIDGMNEKGLSFEALYLPGLAQYQVIPPGKNSQALPYMNLGDWILSNFDSVDQVRQAISKIVVYAGNVPGMGNMQFPLHFSVFEASGKGIVIEYVGGKLNIYDNPLGVMTNSPIYPWHLTNLDNYVHLIPENPSPILYQGLTFSATGQGAGMVGIPGDISPPSRFVKIATMLRVIFQANDALSNLNLAQHVINNVDIPLGLAREPKQGQGTSELTQWVVFKDLTHKVLYYRTYGNLSLRAVSLSNLNFSEKALRLKMPIVSSEYVQDLSDAFNKSAQTNLVPST